MVFYEKILVKFENYLIVGFSQFFGLNFNFSYQNAVEFRILNHYFFSIFANSKSIGKS